MWDWGSIVLVVLRRNGEGIRIGNIEFTVLDKVRGGVRIGITAPDDVEISRLELLDRTDRRAQKIDSAKEALDYLKSHVDSIESANVAPEEQSGNS